MSIPVAGTIHDGFFKQLMTEPATAALFLRERLPPDIAALLSDGIPELVPGSFVDEDLVQHHTDLLYRTHLAEDGAEALVFILVEHKSAPDPMVGVQLLRYVTRIWTKWEKEGRGRPLPFVIPLVVYHGSRSWLVPPGFHALFGKMPAAVAPYIPAFDFALADLSRIDDDALSQERRLRAFLKVLKYILRADLAEHLVTVLQEMVTLDLVDIQRILTYIDKGPVPVEAEALRSAMKILAPEREEEIMGGITQPFFDEGVKQGLARGKAEGKAETLLRLLTRRFGPVPDLVRQRIAQADTQALDAWCDAVLDAPSLDSMFPPPASH